MVTPDERNVGGDAFASVFHRQLSKPEGWLRDVVGEMSVVAFECRVK
jgi:hypothetical protein